MPSPVIPDQFSDSIPLNNALFCERFSKFLGVPELLSQVFGWMLNPDGSLSDAFKAEIAATIYPAGTPLWTLASSIGSGFLLADGSEYSRADYPALFVAIGTRYGEGNGTTTANLPDMRGRSPIGSGAGAGLTNRDINAKYVGEERHTLLIEEVPAHTHSITSYSAGATGGDGGDILNLPDPGVVHPHDTAAAGGGIPFNVIHPCVIGHWWIKT